MYLDIIILGMLRHGPMHGYEIKQRVRRVTLNDLSNNSLYPALRRFEQEGVATKSIEVQEGRPPRKVYEITDHGRAQFEAMISSLPAGLAGNDEEFLVRVGFFADIRMEQRRAILAARDAALAERITALRALEQEPSRSRDRAWRDETTAWYLSRIEAERSWIAGLARKAGA